MFFKPFFSIKRSLMALQSLIFIVLIIIFVNINLKDAKKTLEDKKQDYLDETRFVAKSVTSLDAIRLMLKTLSHDPAIKNLERERISVHFKSIVKETDLFQNIGIFDLSGNPVVTAKEVPKDLNVSDRLFFKRALTTKDFVWGEFAISKSTGKSVIHFAIPVLNEKKEVLSVISVLPVMDKLFIEHEKLRHDSFILDENGIIVSSKHENAIGTKYKYFDIINTGVEEGIITIPKHYIAFTQIKNNGRVFSTLVSEIPFSMLSILQDEGFFRNLFILMFIFATFLLLINKISKRFIIEPILKIENHIKKYSNEGSLLKIEENFQGELESFKKVYNSFIETLNNKKEEIEVEKDFWLNIFNNIPDPIFIVDKDYKITIANQSLLELFQLKEEDIRNLHCYEICHKTKSPIDFCPHQTLLEKNLSTSYEIFSPDLKKWFLITFTTFAFPGKLTGTLHIMKDITDIKAAEQEKLRIERQLLHTQKLESLGILAGGIAHDFNNLLMGILGNAELAILNKEKLPPSVIQNIEMIKKITEKAAHLTRQMLAYSGKGKFVIKEIDINAFIREIYDLIKVSISKNAVISLNLDEKSPLVIKGDTSQIEQVILNLIINASEALEEKEGLITITTGKQYCDNKYFENTVDGSIRTFKEGDYVYFEITDSGCGMDKETMNRIFEPFFTTKFTGRGLGLSAILGIVRGHNGAIRVYSEKGKGTSFKLLFPAVTPTPQTNDDKKYFSNLDNKTFLIIDDEEIVREVTRSMIEVLGGRTFIAKDGKEGIEIFKKNNDKIDYILLDLTMPGLSGDEVFREVKKIKSNVFVILMSGYNEQDISQRLVGKGFAGFVQKPFTVEKLIEVIHSSNNA